MKLTIFKTKEDAIVKLSKYASKFQIPQLDLSDELLVNYSVGGSIFRAFSITNHSGSAIYKTWAKQNLKKLIIDLKQSKSQSKFDAVVMKYSYSFINYWSSNILFSNERIGFGPASKIVNLLIKVIQQSTNHRVSGINQFLNVPFDLYTLRPLKLIINELTNIQHNINIPSSATMGYVVNEELYWEITKAIRKLCKEANTNPIIYEYWGWDRNH